MLIEGERLFSQLHVNNPTEDSETDSLTSDAVIRHAQLLFDSNSPLDQILPEKKLIFVSPEVYFSVTSLKVSSFLGFNLLYQFLSKFIQATEEFTNFSLLPLQAQATHFRLHFLLKKSFRCWVQKIQFRKEKSDSEEEEEDQLTKVPFS